MESEGGRMSSITFGPAPVRPCHDCKKRAALLLDIVGIAAPVALLLIVLSDLRHGKATHRETVVYCLWAMALILANGILIGRRQGINVLADKLNAARMAEYAQEDEPEAAPVHAVEPITDSKEETAHE
jgi:hypothetical protein